MAQLIGYFFIMILFTGLGIVFAKKTAGWILLAVGALIQLVSLYGMKTQLKLLGVNGGNIPGIYWVVFFLILVIGISVISIRRSKNN